MVEELQHTRRQRAISGTCLALDDLRRLGVEAAIIGSLSKGTFGPCSDVDILIVKCPASLKYAIESIVEDRLGDIPFDVIYLDEIPPHKIAGFTEGAVSASRIQ